MNIFESDTHKPIFAPDTANVKFSMLAFITGWIVGIVVTLGLLVLGASVTVSYVWTKKRKAIKRRSVTVSRRWTRRDPTFAFVEGLKIYHQWPSMMIHLSVG